MTGPLKHGRTRAPRRMITGTSFKAKPGKARELEALLNDPERGRAVAKAMGATRNVLFWQGDRMVRVMEFPEGGRPVPMSEIAARDPDAREFLRRIGDLAEPGYDLDRPETMDAFGQAGALRLLYDVRA